MAQLFDIDLEKVLSLDKKSVRFRNSVISSSGKAIISFKGFSKINSGHKYPVNCSRLQNLVLGNTVSSKEVKTPRLNQEKRVLIESEVQETLKKVLFIKCRQRRFWSNVFLVSKKDGRNQPVVNLKHLNSFIPYQRFKMEGVHVRRIFSPGKRLYDKSRFKRCLF